MTSPAAAVAVVAGVGLAAYALTAENGSPNMVPADELPPPPPPSRKSRKQQVSYQPSWLANYNGAVKAPPNPHAPGGQPAGVVGGPGGEARDSATRQAIDAEAKKAYDKLEPRAKQEGAALINRSMMSVTSRSPGLTGEETYAEACAAIGAAAGAALGTMAVAAIPGVGPLLASTGIGNVLGAIIGGYLGAAWAEWTEEYWNKAKDWVVDTAEDIYDEAADLASDAYDEVVSWF